ncbi:methyltransferase HEMK2-like [Clavelina lepadiformis]|uniref:methyltransferase HEMK2-like n=1 Tax=Clavelina lepadiformis TaxID=159417 RepID=UPI004041171C
MKIATPIYSHVADYESVYEPAEDTFLLLDALESEIGFLKKLRPSVALEVGCGSGVVSTFLFKILGASTTYLCTDKNSEAAACCHVTADLNQAPLNIVTTDLVTGLLPRLENSCDILLFNPPYVVTPSDEIKKPGISLAWAGGVNGREVMDRFFPLVPKLLTDKGVFYLVVVKENKPDEISRLFREMSFSASTVKSRRSGPECLSIMKFQRLGTKSGSHG